MNEKPSNKPIEVEGLVLKSFLDIPPLEARPSLAERVAALEARVRELEAAQPGVKFEAWHAGKCVYFETRRHHGFLVNEEIDALIGGIENRRYVHLHQPPVNYTFVMDFMDDGNAEVRYAGDASRLTPTHIQAFYDVLKSVVDRPLVEDSSDAAKQHFAELEKRSGWRFW